VQGYCASQRQALTGRGGAATAVKATEQRARLAKGQADLAELKVARLRGQLVDATALEAEWATTFRHVRAGMLAASSRCAQRLPHLTAHDVSEIDAEIRQVLTEIGTNDDQ
jgi:phage terminase Nu1 subunit (DNA packaging protein)